MKIAAVQLACTLGDVQANLNKIRDFCRRAKQEGVDLIVFPEAADTGYSMPVIREQAKPWTEGAVPALQEMAKEFALTIVSGVSERAGDLIYNSQVFIDAGVVCCGTSAIIDPSGVIIASASDDREEMIVADVSEEVVRSVRERMGVFEHRRADLYSRQ